MLRYSRALSPLLLCEYGLYVTYGLSNRDFGKKEEGTVIGY
jgi:hypothetical protein